MTFSNVVYVPKLDTKNDPVTTQMINTINEVADREQVQVYSYDDLFQASSQSPTLFISLGGDGTMLAAMRAAVKHRSSSVVGFNFGHLGFLTNGSVESANFETMLTSLMRGEPGWKRDSRMVVKANITQPHDYRHIEAVAINEFLVTTETRKHQMTYDVFVNNSHVAQQAGDGVIVTTATGSTAYAMSAGGAIMAPTSRAIQIVPLAAHTISSRPVVVSEDDVVRIKASATTRVKDICILSDNNCVYSTHMMDVEISKFGFVDVWRPEDWNYFEVLRKKLGWNYGET